MEQAILWASTLFTVAVLGVLLREDWFHLSRPKRRVMARVLGHATQSHDAKRSFAARLEFTGEDGKPFQVNDNVYAASPRHTIGGMIEMTHPEGMPQLARIRRPWMRCAIYAVLLYLLAVLVGRLGGWLSAGGM